jgi:hypothetical protein
MFALRRSASSSIPADETSGNPTAPSDSVKLYKIPDMPRNSTISQIIRVVLASAAVWLLPCGVAQAQGEKNPPADPRPKPGKTGKPTIPRDLVVDEHLREEYGVNGFTTPSIKKLFEQLDELGSLPYEELKRKIPSTPRDRGVVALSLGVVIADGFLAVNSDQILDLRDIGGAVLKHAKILGSGKGAIRHVKTILENSALEELGVLKDELAKTQLDVEAEMVLLRDVDIAHLVGLGGWLRALEIASRSSVDPFKPERAKKLARVDIVAYFVHSLSELDPKVRANENIKRIDRRLKQVLKVLETPGGPDGTLTQAQVRDLAVKSTELVKLSTREFKRAR